MVEADHMTPDEVIEWLEEEARVAVQDARHQFLVKNDEGRAHYRAKALSRGDGWRPISEFVEKAYDDHILVGNADWDAPITVEAYQLRPESIAKWTGAPTHYHTGIPLPPVPEGEE